MAWQHLWMLQKIDFSIVCQQWINPSSCCKGSNTAAEPLSSKGKIPGRTPGLAHFLLAIAQPNLVKEALWYHPPRASNFDLLIFPYCLQLSMLQIAWPIVPCVSSDGVTTDFKLQPWVSTLSLLLLSSSSCLRLAMVELLQFLPPIQCLTQAHRSHCQRCFKLLASLQSLPACLAVCPAVGLSFQLQSY